MRAALLRLLSLFTAAPQAYLNVIFLFFWQWTFIHALLHTPPPPELQSWACNIKIRICSRCLWVIIRQWERAPVLYFDSNSFACVLARSPPPANIYLGPLLWPCPVKLDASHTERNCKKDLMFQRFTFVKRNNSANGKPPLLLFFPSEIARTDAFNSLSLALRLVFFHGALLFRRAAGGSFVIKGGGCCQLGGDDDYWGWDFLMPPAVQSGTLF